MKTASLRGGKADAAIQQSFVLSVSDLEPVFIFDGCAITGLLHFVRNVVENNMVQINRYFS
jgi:hypothetical protein